MPTPHTSPTDNNPTHDLVLSADGEAMGFMLDDETSPIRETSASDPTQSFLVEQKSYLSGRGRVSFADDPMGFFDSNGMWTMTDGHLFPSMMWRWSDGLRSGNHDRSESLSILYPAAGGGYTASALVATSFLSARWRKCISSSISISKRIYPEGNYTATTVYIWLKQIGSPGTGTLELYDATPTLLASATITASSTQDEMARIEKFTISQALTTGSSTNYYTLKFKGATGDNETKCWQVLEGTEAGLGGDDGVWSLKFNMTAAATARKFYSFELDGALYVVDQKNDGTASTIYLSGDRGTATSGTSTGLVDTSQNWSYLLSEGDNDTETVRIVAGTGVGQTRKITARAATGITVTPAWDITPDTSSQYVIHGSRQWKPITLTGTALGAITGPPTVAGSVAFFPQGGSVNILRVRFNGTGHDGAADGTNKADLLHAFVSQSSGMQIWRSLASAISYATPPVWGGAAMSFTALTGTVGSAGYATNSIFDHENMLYIGREDGLYKIVGTYAERDEQFTTMTHPNNCKAYGSHNKSLYVNWGNSTLQILQGTATDIDNYKAGYDGLPSNRNGMPTAYVPAIGWVFKAVDANWMGTTTNYSGVYCWNGFGWHEVFRGWKGSRVRNAFWQSNPGTYPRLWIDIDGDLVSIKFPKDAANPLKTKESATAPVNDYIFMPEAALITSTIDLNKRSLYKFFKEITTVAEDLFTETDANGTIISHAEIDYQLDDDIGGDNWSRLSGTIFNTPIDKLALGLGGILQARFRIRLISGRLSRPTIIRSWAIDGNMKSPAKYQWNLVVLMGANVLNKAGEVDNPQTQLDWLQEKAAKESKIIVQSRWADFHDKVVTIEQPTVSLDDMSDIVPAEWDATVWLTARE